MKLVTGGGTDPAHGRPVLTLKDLRVARGLSQKEVAEASGHSEEWVSKRESLPVTEVGRDVIREYAEACGYEADA